MGTLMCSFMRAFRIPSILRFATCAPLLARRTCQYIVIWQVYASCE